MSLLKLLPCCDRSIETLYVFDFDGTLFRSPVPNKDRWNNAMYGRLQNAEPVGYGWFQKCVTLLPPAVPDPPTGLWIEWVVERAREAIADPNGVAVMMTGRGEIFRSRIEALLNAEGLFFRGVYLKPQGQTVFVWKSGLINELIKNHKPSTVIVYEDRPHHAEKFAKHLAARPHEVILVKEPSNYLSPGVEDEVVRALGVPDEVIAEGRVVVPDVEEGRESLLRQLKRFEEEDAQELTLEGLTAPLRALAHDYASERNWYHGSSGPKLSRVLVIRKT
eukprot:Sspe_Gene.67904::Locus_40044_Transcript_1_1_Confidence_1.000_Length_993::g.67904::m.67904